MTYAELVRQFPGASLAFYAANASDGLPPELASKAAKERARYLKGAEERRKALEQDPKLEGRLRAAAKRRVPRTHNAGTWTEARYWQAVRSTMRRAFRFWKPAVDALRAARVASRGPRGRKWLYLCADCNKLFPRKQVEIDHVEPCGKLTSFDHIPDFLRRLTPESPDAYRVRCIECHQVKTNTERVTTRRQDGPPASSGR